MNPVIATNLRDAKTTLEQVASLETQIVAPLAPSAMRCSRETNCWRAAMAVVLQMRRI